MIIYLVAIGVGIGLLVFVVTRVSARHDGKSGSSSHFSPSDPGPG